VAVLVVLGAAVLLSRLAGAAGVDFLDSWPEATRAGLAVMLLFTGSAHFNSMRHDLARMNAGRPWSGLPTGHASGSSGPRRGITERLSSGSTMRPTRRVSSNCP
jgi:hypothetical protein